mgnify:CR=1 FL=1
MAQRRDRYRSVPFDREVLPSGGRSYQIVRVDHRIGTFRNGFRYLQGDRELPGFIGEFRGTYLRRRAFLREENLEAFTERFLKIASEEIIPEQMIPQIDIDAILDLKEINQKFVNDLKKMSRSDRTTRSLYSARLA